MAVERFAGGLRFEQDGGEVLDGLLGGELLADPALAAERVEVWPAAADADVAAEEVRLRNRDIELGLLRVFDGQHFLELTVELDFVEPEILADAVVDVHDQFAGLNVCPFRQPRGRSARAGPFAVQLVAAGQFLPEPEQVGLRDDEKTRRFDHEPLGQRPDPDVQAIQQIRFLPVHLDKTIVRAFGIEEQVNSLAALDPVRQLVKEFPTRLIEYVGRYGGVAEPRQTLARFQVQFVRRRSLIRVHADHELAAGKILCDLEPELVEARRVSRRIVLRHHCPVHFRVMVDALRFSPGEEGVWREVGQEVRG